MSNCPKCGHKLRLFDIDQKCPYCGVNIRFYRYDEVFERDAKNAELSAAAVNKFVATLKTAFVGSKLTIARIGCVLLPVLGLLLPFASADMTLPFRQTKLTLSALGLYGAFSDGTLQEILSLLGSSVDGGDYVKLAVAIIAMLLVAITALVIVVMEIINFVSLKKMPRVMRTTAIVGIVLTLFCVVMSFVLGGVNTNSLAMKASFGSMVEILTFVAVIVINVLIEKQRLEPVLAEGTAERVEIRKKIKAGELRLEDLPQPIVQTAETRRIDEEILKEKQNLVSEDGADGGTDGKEGDENG